MCDSNSTNTVIKCWEGVGLEGLDALAGELRVLLKTPAVVALSGDLGLGKTTLVQSFVGVATDPSERALSPTYSLINQVGDVTHGDFYRLKGAEDLVYLEVPIYLRESGYFFVEWGLEYLSELVREIGSDRHYYHLQICHSGDLGARDYRLYSLDDL